MKRAELTRQFEACLGKTNGPDNETAKNASKCEIMSFYPTMSLYFLHLGNDFVINLT